MRLFKQENTEFYGVADLTDEQLIAGFNICINYKGYLSGIMKLKDNELIAFAPGRSANEVRKLLKLQEKTCSDYIEMWQKNINARFY